MRVQPEVQRIAKRLGNPAKIIKQPPSQDRALDKSKHVQHALSKAWMGILTEEIT